MILNKSRKKFKKMKCHPKTQKNNVDSCFDEDTLLFLKNKWNGRHPDLKINSNNPKFIYKKLKQYYSNTCTNELCILNKNIENDNAKKMILKRSFAPFAPNSWNRNSREWLSSIDIMNVMKQYDETYDNFEFIGPSPINYDSKRSDFNNECVWPELCNFSIKEKIQKNIDNIGFIFNTDPHYKGGSHWIALYLDLKNKYIFYFDSNGNEPPFAINKLIKKILTQANEENIKLIEDSNYGVRHQTKDDQCGIYCLYFLIQLLKKNKSKNFFKKKMIGDNKISKFRNIYFNYQNN